MADEKKKQSRKRVSEKISVLRKEGEPQDRAIGMALNMERAGRLGRHGMYHHVRKGSRRRSGGR